MSQQPDSNKAEELKQELDDDLLASAKDLGIDVDDLVQKKLDKHSTYSPSTVAKFVTSDLRNQIEAARAEELSGIIMGSRDRYNKNFPRQHSLIRSSGEHLEVSTWDGTLQDPNGNEVKIPTGGSIINWRCEYDEEYDSYEAKRIESVQPLELDDLADKLRQVAIDPSDLSKADEYQIVAVHGTINYVDAQTIFNDDGEPERDGPVLMEDARGEKQPHFEVTLARDGNTSVSGHVERQRYGRPYFAVTDLMKLTTDAYEMYDSPDEQAEFIRSGLQGTDVIIVGNVNKYNTTRTDDGEPLNYVNISVSAIIESNPDTDALEPTGTDEPEETSDEPAEEPEEDAEEPEEDAGDTEPGEEEAPAVDDVAADIQQYAELVGEDIQTLTASDIVENAKGIDAPESVISYALRKLSDGDVDADEGDNADESTPAGGEDPGAEDGDGSVEGFQSLSEKYAPIKESGNYQCPGEDGDGDCMGKGAGITDLIGHIVDEHSPETPSEARDWLDERV